MFWAGGRKTKIGLARLVCLDWIGWIGLDWLVGWLVGWIGVVGLDRTGLDWIGWIGLEIGDARAGRSSSTPPSRRGLPSRLLASGPARRPTNPAQSQATRAPSPSHISLQLQISCTSSFNSVANPVANPVANRLPPIIYNDSSALSV